MAWVPTNGTSMDEGLTDTIALLTLGQHGQHSADQVHSGRGQETLRAEPQDEALPISAISEPAAREGRELLRRAFQSQHSTAIQRSQRCAGMTAKPPGMARAPARTRSSGPIARISNDQGDEKAGD
jgi:hypothetical protein